MDEKKLQNDNKQLINIIQAQYPRLSKGQKLIAQYIINNYDKVAFMTASKLGEAVGVSILMVWQKNTFSVTVKRHFIRCYPLC